MTCNTTSKIIDLNSAHTLRETYKNNHQRVIFTNGCFDILHVGHTTYLEQAKNLGDILIVGINSDTSVQKLKGPTRPINPETDRAQVLAALECVNHVIIFSEQTPITLIETLKPDIHVKGGDYHAESLPEFPIIQAFGGKVVILPFVYGKSTTATIKKINPH